MEAYCTVISAESVLKFPIERALRESEDEYPGCPQPLQKSRLDSCPFVSIRGSKFSSQLVALATQEAWAMLHCVNSCPFVVHFFSRST